MNALIRREASVSAVELGDQWAQGALIRASGMQQYKRFAMSSLIEPKIRRLLLAWQHRDTILKPLPHFSITVEVSFEAGFGDSLARRQRHRRGVHFRL